VRLVIALALVVACSAPATSTNVGGTNVTWQGSPLEGCSPTRVAEGVRRFLAAFNRGDQAALLGIFKRSVLFTSAYAPPAGFFRSGGQQQLLDYFAQRHAQHEILELMALHIQYQVTPEAGLAPRMNRTSDDLPPGIVTAKVVFDCNDGAIIAWNQGEP
jgi:hypothetical protein